jgi:parallel beta-helix repeat protein
MFRCPASMMLILILASTASGATVVVDDDGSGNFTTIQEAINASEIGDVIVVQNGTYPENLVVDRSIVLKGENGPVVKGSGLSAPLITITSDNVTLEGFTFSGCINDCSDFGAVLVLADGCKLLNSTISASSGNGLCLRNSSYHLVSGNLIHDNQPISRKPGVQQRKVGHVF